MIEEKKLKYSKWFAGVVLGAGFFWLAMSGLSWGATIGNSTIEASTYTSFAGRGFATASKTAGNLEGVYTAVAGDSVDTLTWYGGWGADATDLTLVMSIYTVINDSIPNALVDSASVTVNSGTDQWWPVVVNISLTAGVKYIFAWVAKDNHSYSAKRLSCAGCTVQQALAGAAFTDPWVDLGARNGVLFSGYGFVSNAPPASGGNKAAILK